MASFGLMRFETRVTYRIKYIYIYIPKASLMRPWLPEATGSTGLRPIFTTFREARKVIKTNTCAAVDPGGGICNGLWSVSVYVVLSLECQVQDERGRG